MYSQYLARLSTSDARNAPSSGTLNCTAVVPAMQKAIVQKNASNCELSILTLRVGDINQSKFAFESALYSQLFDQSNDKKQSTETTETMEVAAHVDDYNASFRDTVWLQSFPLTAQTVLHYFALSPFYDRSCNNERLKMQRLGLEQLKNMRGVEYELLPNLAQQLPQQLFLIRKQRRSSRNQVEPLAVYYVLDGTVYQAPNIHAMLTSRLVRQAVCVVLV